MAYCRYHSWCHQSPTQPIPRKEDWLIVELWSNILHSLFSKLIWLDFQTTCFFSPFIFFLRHSFVLSIRVSKFFLNYVLIFCCMCENPAQPIAIKRLAECWNFCMTTTQPIPSKELSDCHCHSCWHQKPTQPIPRKEDWLNVEFWLPHLTQSIL